MITGTGPLRCLQEQTRVTIRKQVFRNPARCAGLGNEVSVAGSLELLPAIQACRPNAIRSLQAPGGYPRNS